MNSRHIFTLNTRTKKWLCPLKEHIAVDCSVSHADFQDLYNG